MYKQKINDWGYPVWETKVVECSTDSHKFQDMLNLGWEPWARNNPWSYFKRPVMEKIVEVEDKKKIF